MSLNDIPSSERIHIGFFGCRNVGKSSLLNAVTGQELSIVSAVKGTTTDPVMKSMELLPLGPVVVIDTPGLDDDDELLGRQRIAKAKQAMNRCDIAVLVVDGYVGMTHTDMDILKTVKAKEIPYVIAVNKADAVAVTELPENGISVSALSGYGVHELKERLGRLAAGDGTGSRRLVGDLLKAGDVVVLVTPIDESAPRGRIILPQQQTLRDILDSHAAGIVVQVQELPAVLDSLGQSPRLVITDSQAFGPVSKIVPADVPLTSFSILMSRYRGYLESAIRGAAALDRLQEGAKVLIAEGCTHHRQCNDIGSVKLPGWIRQHAGCESLKFDFASGLDFPDDLSQYSVIVHCGGCMVNEREMRFRAKSAADQDVPLTNYGIAIAHMHGILRRSLGPFPALASLLDSGR